MTHDIEWGDGSVPGSVGNTDAQGQFWVTFTMGDSSSRLLLSVDGAQYLVGNPTAAIEFSLAAGPPAPPDPAPAWQYLRTDGQYSFGPLSIDGPTYDVAPGEQRSISGTVQWHTWQVWVDQWGNTETREATWTPADLVTLNAEVETGDGQLLPWPISTGVGGSFSTTFTMGSLESRVRVWVDAPDQGAVVVFTPAAVPPPVEETWSHTRDELTIAVSVGASNGITEELPPGTQVPVTAQVLRTSWEVWNSSLGAEEIRNHATGPAIGAQVTFGVTSGDGLVPESVPPLVTDAEGRVSTVFTMGESYSILEASVGYQATAAHGNCHFDPNPWTYAGSDSALAMDFTLDSLLGYVNAHVTYHAWEIWARNGAPGVTRIQNESSGPAVGAEVTFALTPGGGLVTVTGGTGMAGASYPVEQGALVRAEAQFAGKTVEAELTIPPASGPGGGDNPGGGTNPGDGNNPGGGNPPGGGDPPSGGGDPPGGGPPPPGGGDPDSNSDMPEFVLQEYVVGVVATIDNDPPGTSGNITYPVGESSATTAYKPYFSLEEAMMDVQSMVFSLPAPEVTSTKWKDSPPESKTIALRNDEGGYCNHDPGDGESWYDDAGHHTHAYIRRGLCRNTTLSGNNAVMDHDVTYPMGHREAMCSRVHFRMKALTAVDYPRVISWTFLKVWGPLEGDKQVETLTLEFHINPNELLSDPCVVRGADPVPGSLEGLGSMVLLPVEVEDEIFMFSGHDGDVVHLKIGGNPDIPNLEWRLKSQDGTIGTFSHATTTDAEFKALKPATDEIELVIDGKVVWAADLEILEIISRSGWGARAPDSTISTAGTIPGDSLTYHHSSKAGNTGAEEARRIQDLHMDEGIYAFIPGVGNDWPDIGYHYLIDKAGKVYEGRSLESTPGKSGGPFTKGTHVAGANTVAGIGICMMGDFEKTEGNEAFTATVQKNLEKVLIATCRRYEIPRENLSYHSARALASSPSLCTGSNAIPKASKVKENVTNNLQYDE